MKIFVTGASGLLGSKVVEFANKEGHRIFSGYLNHMIGHPNPIKIDVKDKKNILNVITEIRPEVIIHCAALTDVDECEINKKMAIRINSDGARFIAEAAKEINAYLAFISTDYVFDGTKGMYKENDIAKPINFYGYSKLIGEKAIAKITENYMIARTSVVFGARSMFGKKNFALWIKENLSQKQEINVLIDQYVSPTLNTNLAKMLLEACEKSLRGVYHMSGLSRISRYDFSIMLAEILDLDESLIKKSRMSDMHWRAKRPKDSSLDVSKAYKILKTKPMDLGEALKLLKEEIGLASRNNN